MIQSKTRVLLFYLCVSGPVMLCMYMCVFVCGCVCASIILAHTLVGKIKHACAFERFYRLKSPTPRAAFDLIQSPEVRCYNDKLQ